MNLFIISIIRSPKNGARLLLNSEMATVICQIKNAFIINPINGKAERFSSLQDTLQLIKEGNKWLVRKDIPLQNGKQNHD